MSVRPYHAASAPGPAPSPKSRRPNPSKWGTLSEFLLASGQEIICLRSSTSSSVRPSSQSPTCGISPEALATVLRNRNIILRRSTNARPAGTPRSARISSNAVVKSWVTNTW